VEAPASFQPPPLPDAAPIKQGCARTALIGCGIAAALLLLCLVGFFLYMRRNPGLMTDLMMRQIESHYGPDVTEQDKADLRAAYAEFRTALNQRRVNREGVQKLQFTLSANRSNQINRDQVLQLTRDFRAASNPASNPSPGQTRSPSPVPTASP
jgi:hypothetical protein